MLHVEGQRIPKSSQPAFFVSYAHVVCSCLIFDLDRANEPIWQNIGRHSGRRAMMHACRTCLKATGAHGLVCSIGHGGGGGPFRRGHSQLHTHRAAGLWWALCQAVSISLEQHQGVLVDPAKETKLLPDFHRVQEDSSMDCHALEASTVRPCSSDWPQWPASHSRRVSANLSAQCQIQAGLQQQTTFGPGLDVYMGVRLVTLPCIAHSVLVAVPVAAHLKATAACYADFNNVVDGGDLDVAGVHRGLAGR